MSVKLLSDLRVKVAADATLSAYYQARYGRQPSQFIGYKPPNAKDLPSISYVPVRNKLSIKPRHIDGQASLVVAVNEKDLTGNVFDGVTVTEQLILMLRNLLESQPLGSMANFMDLTMTTDTGASHPFYEAELSFKFMALSLYV